MKLIKFKDKEYPMFQAKGNAAKFAIPFAKEVCSGKGYDIGCMKVEWAFPGSIPIDLDFGDEWDAYNLPDDDMDYIFSSHCLEHLPDWVEAMDYWYYHLKEGGILFLYLPDFSQQYWRPWHNRKHHHVFIPEIIKEYMIDRGYKNVFHSLADLNNSFMIFGEK